MASEAGSDGGPVSEPTHGLVPMPPPFPGPRWRVHPSPPAGVQRRALALLGPLWARGEGAHHIDRREGGWIAYVAKRTPRRGVVAYLADDAPSGVGAVAQPPAGVVARVRTPLEPDAVRDSLLKAWPEIDRETAASLLALVWVETGRGASCNNWNVGNLSASETYSPRYRPAWFELTADSSDRMRALHAAMLRKEAPSAFRSYPSLAHGMADYVRLLRSPAYRNVLEAAATGETLPFIKALKTRYSKDYGDQHIPAFSDCRDVFIPLVSHLPAPKLSNTPTPSAQGGIALALLLAKALS